MEWTLLQKTSFSFFQSKEAPADMTERKMTWESVFVSPLRVLREAGYTYRASFKPH